MTTPNQTAELSRTARRELANTLIEQSWARPDALRPVARPHVVLMVAIASAAAAIAIGALLQFLHKSSSGTTASPSPLASATSSVSSFTAVSGWDCASGPSYGFVAHGRATSWHTVASGGWAGDGCHGQFESIPMTGSATKDDPNQFAEWWLTPPAAMTCSVSVFRPAPADRQDSAASAAQFFVLNGLGGTRVGGFVLNEAADPGSWAAAGSFPVSPSGMAIELVDRGVPAFAGARLAITQVKFTCTA